MLWVFFAKNSCEKKDVASKSGCQSKDNFALNYANLTLNCANLTLSYTSFTLARAHFVLNRTNSGSEQLK